MDLQQLLELYLGAAKTNAIVNSLQNTSTSHTHIKGVVGSSAAFISAAVIKKTDNVHLFILPDKEEAAYFFNDLESLLGENSVLFFPSSYKRPYQIEETDNANILLRAEALNKIRNQKQLAIVTYPEAITEKVITKIHLAKNTLELRKGEKLSIDFVLDVLLQYGFERHDFVIEPGQFSIRGGIIDVFSFAHDYPYRIEFFGEEVDTIRSFDPVSQLSVKTLSRITIIPNIEDKQIKEARQSFLEYLTAKTYLWIKDIELCAAKLQKEFDGAEKIFIKQQTDPSPIKHLEPQQLFINKNDFLKQLPDHCILEFGQRFYTTPTIVIQYDFTPQPTFNKNFELLTEALKMNISRGIKNILFADSARQIERLYTIFEDLAALPSKINALKQHVGSNATHTDVDHSKIGKNIPENLFTPILLSVHEGFIDNELKVACYTDHQIFERYHRFRLKDVSYKKKEAITLKELKELNPGDYVTHIDHGIGRFGGLEKIEVSGKLQEAIRLVYKDNDVLYVSINSLHRISKYSGKEGAVPKIDKIGSSSWQTLKQKTKKKVKEIAFDLIKVYAKRKAEKGFAFAPDNYLQNELEASFIYEDTPDQFKATRDVKKDMEQESPMDRLVCGDVGFGKTEVAIRAAFKAVNDSKQVAVLVPTTILALQHYKTFSDRLKGMPCNIDYINRFKTIKEQKDTLKKLAEGKIDILIGTHKIVGPDVIFKDLGLLIIDEEQKFGVAVKDKLKTIKANVDSLTLTATPIPRTLQFSMMGARDLSIISTPPANRYPVHTEVHSFSEELIRDAIQYEVTRGGQVFFVHNRVQSLMEVSGMIKRLCPDVRVATAHGQMKGDNLEKIMLDFVEGYYDVLVATTIIESGLDIPNANTIIINDAQNFGLSDMHQMRGRVGRTNKKAFCYLLIPSFLILTDEARKRLKAIEQFADLGSGFNIAMRDLDIRGAGNLLGAEQSGFITEIGYEMYQKILDEAIDELRHELSMDENNNTLLPQHMADKNFVKDCIIETDMEILIPDEYVNNVTERLMLYRELDESKTEDELIEFEKNITDRFGKIPAPTLELINTIRLRWLAIFIGFEKLLLKNKRLTGYFISKHDSPYFESENFNKVLKFVQQNSKNSRMREGNNKLTLTFENIGTIDEAIAILKKIVSIK